MSWTGCFLATDHPGRFACMDLPLDVSRHRLCSAQRRPRGRSGWPEASPIILALAGRRSGDALPTSSCRSGPPGLVVGSAGLCGPALWLDAVPVKQRSTSSIAWRTAVFVAFTSAESVPMAM